LRFDKIFKQLISGTNAETGIAQMPEIDRRIDAAQPIKVTLFHRKGSRFAHGVFFQISRQLQ